MGSSAIVVDPLRFIVSVVDPCLTGINSSVGSAANQDHNWVRMLPRSNKSERVHHKYAYVRHCTRLKIISTQPGYYDFAVNAKLE